MKSGKVYLVGAGVGSGEFLTQRGAQLLQRAEVVIYDALVDQTLLRQVPAHCEQIDVGKRGGQKSTPQAEINGLLVHHCRRGKRVVRLKSGDPLVFGRSPQEINALRAAGCAYEIIPGVSSALVAPLLAQIPLTDRAVGQGFMVLSGHDLGLYDWQAIARIDTLVILMGARNLPEILQRLQAQGRSPQEAIAIIKAAGTPQQRIWFGKFNDILQKTGSVSLSPAVIVIGQVVNLSPLSHLPLQGKNILITRAVTQSSTFQDLLRAQGATTWDLPTLEITPPSSWEPLDRAIAQLETFSWIIFSSANGVNYFWERLAHRGITASALQGVKVAVVGKKTAQVLAQKGITPDYIPPDYIADSLVTHFPETLVQQRILFPRVESGGRDHLTKELQNQGAHMVEVAAYESQCPQTMDPQVWTALKTGTIDMLTFASSKTVRNFAQLVHQALATEPDLQFEELFKNLAIASIGPQTSAVCGEIFGRCDLEAQPYTLEGLTEAIAIFYGGYGNPKPSP